MKPTSEKKALMPAKNAEDRSLKAPQSIIHVKHRITLRQYKYWILLLDAFREAYEQKQSPDAKGFYRIPIARLAEYIGYEPVNSELRVDFESLRREPIVINVLNKDSKGMQKGMGFISEWEITSKTVAFKLPTFIEEVMRGLDQPRRIFQLLNWDIFNHFSGKYEAILYKLCRDYVGVRQTPYMTIDEFREYMGLELNEYNQFMRLGQWVIYGPCKAISESPVSDISVDPDIDRKGRKAIGIRFLVEPKDKALLPFLEPEPNPAFLHSKVPIPPKTQEKYLGLRAAEEISLCIERANDYGERQEKEGKATNYGALYRTAIEEGWHVEQAVKKAAKEAEQAKKKAEADAKRKAAEDDRARKEKILAEQQATLEWFGVLAAGEQAETVAAFLETAPHTRRSYQRKGFESPIFLFPFIEFLKEKRRNAMNGGAGWH
jgi:hypothetical protein